jgi:protocatechuate 3,4-dioxygenase beta subunit
LAWRLLIASALVYAPTLLGQVRDNGVGLGPIVVTGLVVAGDGDQVLPLPRVRVGVQGDPQGPTLTDDEGRFQLIISGDGGGLRLAKTGYAPLFVERQALHPGTQLAVRMAKGGAVTGTVVDAQGLPLANVAVRVRRVTDGAPVPGGAAQSIAETDDLGEFRVGNLAAGRYSVAATAPGGRGGRGAIQDLLGGPDGVRALIDTLGNNANVRDLLQQAAGGQVTPDAAAGQQGGANTGGGRGRGRFGGNNNPGANNAQGANNPQGTNNTAGNNNAANAPAGQNQGRGAQARGGAANAQGGAPQNGPARGQGPNGQQNGGRRGGRGNGDQANQDQTIVEVKAGEDSSISITSESPDTQLQQLLAQVQQAQATQQAQRTTTTSTTTNGAPAANGIVHGRVLGADGQPIKGAQVVLSPVNNSGTRRAAATDANGRYEMTGVAAGSYRARVTKSGLADVEYGQKRTLDPGRVINVALNQRVENIDVTMPRPSAVVGAVTDKWGEPLEGATLQIWQASFVDGRTTLQNVPNVRQRRTDDRGHYRLFGLLPGTYYVVASEPADDPGFPGGSGGRGGGRGGQGGGGNRGGRGGRGGPGGPQNDGILRVFYPGTMSASSATPVVIDVGQDAGGVDFTFNTSRAANIRGVAMSVSGQPSRGRAILAVSQRSGEPMVPLQTTMIEDDGSFEFSAVAAGDYVVQVVTNPGNQAGGAGGRGGFNNTGRGQGGQNGGGAGGQNGGGGRQGGGNGNNGGFGGGGGQAAGGQPGAVGGVAGAVGGQGRGGGGTGGGRQANGGGAQGGGAGGRGGNGAGQNAAANGGRGRNQNAVQRQQRQQLPREFGMTYVTVQEGESAMVRIDTGPGIPVTGQIMLEGDTGTVTLTSFGLTANAVNADTSPLAGARNSRATVNDDGTFVFDDLVGTTRFASAVAPQGWWLKSVTINGINGAIDPVTFNRGDQPIENVTATFASGTGSIEGRVLDDRRQPTGDFGVVIFSTDADKWFSQSPFLKLGSPAQDGTFNVSGLPPDEYLVAALDRIDGGPNFGDWQNPAVLTTLTATAKRVKLGSGQTVSTELRMLRSTR